MESHGTPFAMYRQNEAMACLRDFGYPDRYYGVVDAGSGGVAASHVYST